MRRPLALLMIAGATAFSLARAPGAQTTAAPRTTAGIDEADLRTRLFVFADDSMEGRRAGSRGHVRATAYIARELTRLGLRPAGDNGTWFQRVRARSGNSDSAWSRNVVAILPGSDPALRGEYVALGAHSDHIGFRAGGPVDHDSLRAYDRAVWAARGRRAGAPELSAAKRRAIRVDVAALRRVRPARPDSINNGADDDGSGSMALLEIAEYLASRKAPLRRSVLFVWHTGEEIDLNGSREFTERPSVPLASIIAQLNIDMIGRGGTRDLATGGPNYLSIIGPRRLSSDLAGIVKDVNGAQPTPFALDYSLDADGHPEAIYCRSDHWNYARRGIPIVFLFTNLHEDYHEVTDEVQYIDFPHYTRVTRYINALLRTLANNDARPRVDRPVPALGAPCSQ
jgi:Peptidase family M28